MKNLFKIISFVGAPFMAPNWTIGLQGAMNRAPTIILLLVVFLSGCKINLNILSTDDEDKVASLSNSFNCTAADDPASAGCTQEYKPVGECAVDDPNCTEVDAEGSTSDVLAAIPNDGNEFNGWGNFCWVGSGFCKFTITGSDAASTDEATIDASFGGDIVPTPVDQYTYNALGQRASKTVTVGEVTTTTYFIYDTEGHLIGEYDASGNPKREYIWLEGNLLAQYDYTQSATEPAMNYYINDHLGTPVLMLDRSPQENYNLTTGPFGESFGEFKTEGITQNVRFSGQIFDESTGYAQNWHRDYDSLTGRYLQSDPIGLAGGVNTFAYVEGNPVMFWDFMGLSATKYCDYGTGVMVPCMPPKPPETGCPEGTHSAANGRCDPDIPPSMDCPKGTVPTTNRGCVPEPPKPDPTKPPGKDPCGCGEPNPNGTWGNTEWLSWDRCVQRCQNASCPLHDPYG